jgi:hypothetical protein
MITALLKDVFYGVCRLRGWDPLTVTVSASERAVIAERVSDRLKIGWNYAWWPELTIVEQRRYAADWVAETTYRTGDKVWHEDAYWKSLADGNIGHEPADGSEYWGEPGADWRRIVNFRQSGQYEIGSVDLRYCMFEEDPLLARNPMPIAGVRIYGNGLLAPPEAPDEPWVRYRPPAPRVSWTEWVAGTAYSIGDLAYVTSAGVCYRANAATTGQNPPDNPTVWIPVQFPEFLRRYVVIGAYADGLLEREEYWKYDRKAEGLLEELEERLIDQQMGRRVRFG